MPKKQAKLKIEPQYASYDASRYYDDFGWNVFSGIIEKHDKRQMKHYRRLFKYLRKQDYEYEAANVLYEIAYTNFTITSHCFDDEGRFNIERFEQMTRVIFRDFYQRNFNIIHPEGEFYPICEFILSDEAYTLENLQKKFFLPMTLLMRKTEMFRQMEEREKEMEAQKASN